MIEKAKKYLPLIVVVFVALALSTAVQFKGFSLSVSVFANDSMGFFLALLAMLKLFDLPGFANGFQMYDLIAKRARAYALVYPFLELILGLAFLSGFLPMLTNIVTLFIMSVGILGVAMSLWRGLDIRCACLGTSLKVPLSTVTIVENATMAMMALVNIITH